MGLGSGVFISPNTSALLGAVPQQRRGVASGVLAMARTGGMTLGIALGQAAFAMAMAGAPESSVEGVASRRSAFETTFLVASAIAAVAFVLAFFNGASRALHDETTP
jgi:predicted MFS family arabinose efflux permease